MTLAEASGIERAAVERAYQRLFKITARRVADRKEIRAMLIPFNERGEQIGQPMMLGNFEKEVWPKIHESAVAKLHAARVPAGDAFVAFVCESWAAYTDHKPSDDFLPSEQPDRKECVMFDFLGSDWQALAFCLIDRATNALSNEELKFVGAPGPMKWEGRFIRKQPTRQ